MQKILRRKIMEENKIYYEIDESSARLAKNMNSFSDYKTNSATESYINSVNTFNSSIDELIKRYPENYKKNKDKIDYLKNNYSKKLATAINEENRIDSSMPSIMISGAGNFNVRKKEKQNAARDNWHHKYSNLFDEDNYIYNRISGILSNNAIYSKEEDAVNQLEKKLNDLENSQKRMKEANAHYKKNKTMKGFYGLTEVEAKKTDSSIQNAWYKKPYAPFELTNNLATINQVKKRIDTIKKIKGSDEKKYKKVKGLDVIENKDLMRIQLKFDGKPDEKTRELLKSNGFKWSPTNSAWQRQLTSNAQRSTDRVLTELGGVNEPEQQKPQKKEIARKPNSKKEPIKLKSFKDLEQRKIKTKPIKKKARPTIISAFDDQQIENDASAVYRPYRRTKSGKVIFAKDYGLKAFKFRD